MAEAKWFLCASFALEAKDKSDQSPRRLVANFFNKHNQNSEDAMNTFSSTLKLSLVFAGLLAVVGCGADPTNEGPVTSGPPDTIDPHAGHAHPTEGPHHGDLIELGNEEFHAEILHDETAGTVTIYVLDSAATKQVPIDSTEITINVKHDGQPEQFKLAASPDSSDPPQKSSRFVSTDAELGHHLDEDGAEPRLVLSIGGKSYRGVITHSHDHDHAHDHGAH